MPIGGERDFVTSKKARVASGNTAENALMMLNSIDDNVLPYLQLSKFILAEEVSDYIKNLLIFLLSVYKAQTTNKKKNTVLKRKMLIETYDDRDVWRSFLMLDNIEIPEEALKYLGHFFLASTEDKDKEALRLEVENFVGELRDAYYRRRNLRSGKHLVPATRQIIEDSWLLDDFESVAGANNTEQIRQKGVSDFQQLIISRLAESKDVRHLDAKELEEINDAFPGIVNGLRDVQNDYVTANSALLLQRVWKLAYDVCTKEKVSSASKLDSPYLEERKNLLIKAALKNGFNTRLYRDRIRLSLDESHLFQFSTACSTVEDAKNKLNAFTSKKGDENGSSESEQRTAPCGATPSSPESSHHRGPSSPLTGKRKWSSDHSTPKKKVAFEGVATEDTARTGKDDSCSTSGQTMTPSGSVSGLLGEILLSLAYIVANSSDAASFPGTEIPGDHTAKMMVVSSKLDSLARSRRGILRPEKQTNTGGETPPEPLTKMAQCAFIDYTVFFVKGIKLTDDEHVQLTEIKRLLSDIGTP